MSKYKLFVRKKLLTLFAEAFFLFVFLLVALNVGSVHLDFFQVFNSIFHRTGELASSIIWEIRLVRVLSAVIVGLSLAIAGTVMQCVLNNPLASPFTMGISHGAAFGAAFSIVVLKAGEIQNSASRALMISSPYKITAFAFIGSLLGVIVVIMLARLKGISPQSLILAGVAMGFLFMAGTTLLQFLASDTELAAIVFWTFGDLGRVSWKELGIMTGVTIPALIYIFANRWNYNALQSGEDVAKSLGVNTWKVRLTGMFFASLITSVSVAFVGIIGFIGLLGPHMVRGFVGEDHRFLIPSSALWGAILLIFSDALSRIVISPVILPVGIITAFMGTPLFLYILVKGEK